MSHNRRKTRLAVPLILAAVLAWGALLAVGALRFDYAAGSRLPMLKALLIFGCVLAFLGLWIGLLLRSGRRRDRQGRLPGD